MRKGTLTFREFQTRMNKFFGEGDKLKGPHFLITVMDEEMGELASSILSNDINQIGKEISDLIFCLCELAYIFGIDVEDSLQEKYMSKSKDQIWKKWPKQARI